MWWATRIIAVMRWYCRRHNTAALVDRATRIEWVVDMWPRGYLQPPDVMTVGKWVKED